MEWIWVLYKEYIDKQMDKSDSDEVTEEQRQKNFIRILNESEITVLVQEPWQNSVRFKKLAVYKLVENMDLVYDPIKYLSDNFGGGKFKLNFHHGWNFVSTKNFKPEGEPKWVDMPELDA